MATKTGTNGNNTLYGTSDSDVLNGLGGNDILFGRSDGDILRGGDGNDALFGQGGDDRLIGGRGDDVLFGGTGDNTFVFGFNSGEDVITDFTSDVDRDENIIDVRGYGIKSFADLREHLDEDAFGVNIDLGKAAGGSGNVNTVTLLDVDLADLDPHDFLFIA
jgi:Ca2+-binding RTX toxin-like protein